jgi:hypothetical protein
MRLGSTVYLFNGSVSGRAAVSSALGLVAAVPHDEAVPRPSGSQQSVVGSKKLRYDFSSPIDY